VGGTLLTIRTLCRPRFTEDYRHVGGSPLESQHPGTGDRKKIMVTTEREFDVALVSGGHHTHHMITESAT
jgi:hypothetical protein